jgi:hypothetical protein
MDKIKNTINDSANDIAEKSTKELTLIDGFQSTEISKSNLEASELYFTNRVYIDLIRIIKSAINDITFEDSIKANFIRRGDRLFKKAEQFFYAGLFVNTSADTKTFKTEVYELLSELAVLAIDLNLIGTAEEINEIIYNEVANEIVNNLMGRAGREQSAGVLAIHFGLVDDEEAISILESLDLKPQQFSQAISSAWHDIAEIQTSLNFKGDIKKIYCRNIDRADEKILN